MEISQEADLRPFRNWCRDNGIGVSTGYRLVKDGRIKLTKLGKRSYVSRENRVAFLKSLEQVA